MKNTKYILTILSLLSITLVHAQTKYTTAVKLGDAVNSSCDETAPVLSSDGKMLFFARSFCPQNTGGNVSGQDVWFSKLGDDGKWTNAEKASDLLANKYENAPVSLSEDGNKLYVTNSYIAGGKMALGLSTVSKSASGAWENPNTVAIKSFELKKNTFIGYHVSKNGKHLFISRYAKDSTDMEDLFVSNLDASGNWSQPVNLGSTINTKGFETSPFLDANDSTLYFSTNGRSDGYGDGDIYMSKRLDDSWTNWSEPKNLGNVINTRGFDGYFVQLQNGVAYFVSGDENASTGDIYTTKKVKSNSTLFVNLTDKKTGKSLPLTSLTCYAFGTKEVVGKAISENGIAKFSIPTKPAKYYVVAHSQGHVTMEEDMFITNELVDKDTSMAMALNPIEVGQKIQLNHVYFEKSKANLLEESFTELDVLQEVLTENPTMQILIAGHTDSRGYPKANKKLSEDRVKSVVDHLVSKGISAERLKYKGFGSSVPVADNKTEDGRAKNRRVEFQILKN